MFKRFLPVLCSIIPLFLSAQPDRWQQRVEYNMDIEFNAKKHQYQGIQSLIYYNNSPDTLTRIFYHLYLNAFQPGSSMDTRSRWIADPDGRVRDRINKLPQDSIGFEHVSKLTLNGKKVEIKEVETILECDLPEPILPHSKVNLEMTFEAQVPRQIRRTGMDNSEGVKFSMSQWYPKLCEYDEQGWHADPYVAREFYGIWGDFDVTLHIDKDYVVAATGILQNTSEVGYGYEKEGEKVSRPKGEILRWNFKAQNVHDFVWAADKDYKHTQYKADDGTQMHFFYKKGEKTKAWEELPPIMAKVFGYAKDHFGKYPYSDFSYIQGGDGGMEYPMATLILGEGTLDGLVSVATHEMLHNWYYGVLGSNESNYGWMDEGFTTYGENYSMNYLKQLKLIHGEAEEDPMLGDVQFISKYVKSSKAEPLVLHSDHYNTNRSYSINVYVKGAVLLHQLRYIMGNENFEAGMLRYFNTWKFKHPNPEDFFRIMEKQSGMELDWFKENYVNTLRHVDYGIKSVEQEKGKEIKISLINRDSMEMPIDILAIFDDGSKAMYNIPLDEMRGSKKAELENIPFTVLPVWPWVNTDYSFSISTKGKKLNKLIIDPSMRMMDWNLDNNIWEQKK